MVCVDQNVFYRSTRFQIIVEHERDTTRPLIRKKASPETTHRHATIVFAFFFIFTPSLREWTSTTKHGIHIHKNKE